MRSVFDYIVEPTEGDLVPRLPFPPRGSRNGSCVGHFFSRETGAVHIDMGVVNGRFLGRVFDQSPTETVGQKEVAVLVPLQLNDKSDALT